MQYDNRYLYNSNRFEIAFAEEESILGWGFLVPSEDSGTSPGGGSNAAPPHGGGGTRRLLATFIDWLLGAVRHMRGTACLPQAAASPTHKMKKPPGWRRGIRHSKKALMDKGKFAGRSEGEGCIPLWRSRLKKREDHRKKRVFSTVPASGILSLSVVAGGARRNRDLRSTSKFSRCGIDSTSGTISFKSAANFRRLMTFSKWHRLEPLNNIYVGLFKCFANVSIWRKILKRVIS